MRNAVIVRTRPVPRSAGFKEVSPDSPHPSWAPIAVTAAIERAGIESRRQIDEVIHRQRPPGRRRPEPGAPSGAQVPVSIRQHRGVHGQQGVRFGPQVRGARRSGHQAPATATSFVAGGHGVDDERAPYLIRKARDGIRLGHGELTDSMIADGLWDVYEDYHMGNTGELVASTSST